MFFRQNRVMKRLLQRLDRRKPCSENHSSPSSESSQYHYPSVLRRVDFLSISWRSRVSDIWCYCLDRGSLDTTDKPPWCIIRDSLVSFLRIVHYVVMELLTY